MALPPPPTRWAFARLLREDGPEGGGGSSSSAGRLGALPHTQQQDPAGAERVSQSTRPAAAVLAAPPLRRSELRRTPAKAPGSVRHAAPIRSCLLAPSRRSSTYRSYQTQAPAARAD